MQNLVNARKAKGKTQQEVADYLGISRQAYSNYEAGKREPDFETLLKLGEYFDCSVDYLLGTKKTPPVKVWSQTRISNLPFSVVVLFRMRSSKRSSSLCVL